MQSKNMSEMPRACKNLVSLEQLPTSALDQITAGEQIIGSSGTYSLSWRGFTYYATSLAATGSTPMLGTSAAAAATTGAISNAIFTVAEELGETEPPR
jgi:hypothetical protein